MIAKKDWIDSKEAAEIATRKNGHTVTDDYIRLRARDGKITTRPKPGNMRQKEFLRKDVEKLRVEGKGKNRPESAGPTVRQQRAMKRRAELEGQEAGENIPA